LEITVIAYEMAAQMIGVTLWAYLGGLIGLLWGLHGVLGQVAEDRGVKREAKAFCRDFLEGRTTLPSELDEEEEEEVDTRLTPFAWEERPLRSSSRPGPMELRLLAAKERARPVLTTPIGYGGGRGLRLMRARPVLLV
jgi:hypothetical protein